jgi:hypothetical protein
MPRPKIGPAIRQEDFDAFKALSPDDPDLPAAFEEWRKNAAEIDAKLKTLGVIVQRIPISPQEFAAWARKTGRDANEAARRSPAAEVSRVVASRSSRRK